MIDRCTLDSQHGDLARILRMFVVLISSTQTTTKASTQLRVTNGRNRLEKTANMYLTAILSAISHKDSIKRMIKIWTESARFNATSRRLAKQARMILKKGWFSDLELQEICKQVNREEYQQDSPIHIETLNP